MSQKGLNEGLSNTQPADTCISITDNATTHAVCRGVAIGTTQSIDLYVQNTLSNTVTNGWVTFAGATAGTILPIMAAGARKTSGTAAPSAGDIVFLY